LQRAHSLRNLRGREVGQAISSPSAEELRHVGRPQYGRLHLGKVNSVRPFLKGASLCRHRPLGSDYAYIRDGAKRRLAGPVT
jgi:hypothetical protein